MILCRGLFGNLNLRFVGHAPEALDRVIIEGAAVFGAGDLHAPIACSEPPKNQASPKALVLLPLGDVSNMEFISYYTEDDEIRAVATVNKVGLGGSRAQTKGLEGLGMRVQLQLSP